MGLLVAAQTQPGVETTGKGGDKLSDGNCTGHWEAGLPPPPPLHVTLVTSLNTHYLISPNPSFWALNPLVLTPQAELQSPVLLSPLRGAKRSSGAVT